MTEKAPWEQDIPPWDDTTIAADVTAQAVSSGAPYQELTPRQERFRAQPGWLQALIGVGAKSHETLIGPTQMAIGFITGGKEGMEEKRRELADMYGTYERAAEGSFPAGVGEYGADIAYTSAPAGVGGKVGKLRKAPGFIKGALTGAGAGMGSAGVHQIQNIGRGGDIEPFGAVVETGVSGVTGGIGGKVAPLTEGLAQKIVQTGMKLSRKIKGQKSMTAKQATDYLNNYSAWSDTWKNILGPEERISKVHANINDKFNNVIEKVARGKQVDLKTVTIETRSKILDMASRGEVDVVDLPKMLKVIEEFEKMTVPLTDPKTGKVDFKIAQKFKKMTLDARAKWDKPTKLGDVDPSLVPAAQTSRAVRRRLTKEMGKEVPEFSIVNKEFSEMAEIEPFIEQTAERYLANRGLSLQDLGTLAGGLIGVGQYYGREREGDYSKLPMLMLLPFIISRAQKSPGAAKLFHEISKKAGSKIAEKTGKAIMQMSRSEFDRRYKVKRSKMSKLFDRYEKTKNPKMKALIERNLNKELEDL